jgi:hypothetical protein
MLLRPDYRRLCPLFFLQQTTLPIYLLAQKPRIVVSFAKESLCQMPPSGRNHFMQSAGWALNSLPALCFGSPQLSPAF